MTRCILLLALPALLACRSPTCPPGYEIDGDRCALSGEVDGGADASTDAPTEDVDCRSYRDADGDGFGDPNDFVSECPPPEGYVSNADDCDDTRADVNPDATELCNGIDDDCDDRIDETFECPQGSTDAACTTSCGSMGSGQCSASCTLDSCDPPAESCSYADDDCDGVIDEGLQSFVPSVEYGSSTAAVRTWTFGGDAPVVFTLYSGGIMLAQRFTPEGAPSGAETEVYTVSLTLEAATLLVDVARVGDDGYVLMVPNDDGSILEARRIGPDFAVRTTTDIATGSQIRGGAITATGTNILVAYVLDDGVLRLRAMTPELVAQAPSNLTTGAFGIVALASRPGSSDWWVAYTNASGLRLQKVRPNGNVVGGAIVVDAAMQRWFPTLALADDGTLGLVYAQGTADDARLNFQVRRGDDGSLVSTRLLPELWGFCLYFAVPTCRPSDVVWSGSRWLLTHVAPDGDQQVTRLLVHDPTGTLESEHVMARSTDQLRMSSGARLASGTTLVTTPTPGRPRYALFGCH